MILGIDEAGRGPWAGPLVVGAVVLGGAYISGLTDSKKLSKNKRSRIYREIVNMAKSYNTGWVSAKELDEIGMSAALRLASIRAVKGIRISYSEIIIDGTVNFLAETGKGKYVKTMPKADLLIPSVSAASIIAKVERDNYMEELDNLYEGYKFGSNAGYGTEKHRLAIEKLGVTPEHRVSFKPLNKYAKDLNRSIFCRNSYDISCKKTIKTTKQIGDAAENSVSEKLINNGHDIIARNWRTRYCEIDIISKKDNTLYFTEVKYRKNNNFGDGFDAIDSRKEKQIRFADELFLSRASYFQDLDIKLLVANVINDVNNITILEI